MSLNSYEAGELVLEALAIGDISKVKQLMEEYPDCEYGLDERFIINLIKNNRLDSIKFLIDIDVYQDLSDDQELYWAVTYGNMEMIKFWINKDNLENIDNMRIVYTNLIGANPNKEVNDYIKSVLSE